MNFVRSGLPSYAVLKPFLSKKVLAAVLFFLVGISLLAARDDILTDIRDEEKNGGDCAAIGPRRPPWANPKKIRRAIPKFARIYNRRPIKDNIGGMRFDHSFALWYMLRTIRPVPSAVIESGAYKGHSAWIIRQALPRVKIISVSPDEPIIKLRDTMYINGGNFEDFNAIQWDDFKFDRSTALVFFDDHQSSKRRIFEEGMSRGFRRFISEDNYDYRIGDSYSMKWICETEGEDQWLGYVSDDFGKKKTEMTWQKHLEEAKNFGDFIKYYYEFPPIATSNITGQTRFKESRSNIPLISDNVTFSAYLGGMDMNEFHFYTHICYTELK